MQIGTMTIDPPVLLAPMAGVSNRAYRAIARKQGATLCITEMVNANALLHKSAKSFWLMEMDPGESPVGIQIAGSDPELMAEAARQAEQQGCDLIDINMGCPAPKVVKNGDGSALLNDAATAVAVVREVVSAVHIPVTVKMRAGWDHNTITAPSLAEEFERVGAKAIAIHARTRDDLYVRPANWDFIRQVKERVSIPVIGNGDIRTPEDAVRMMELTGADGVMIGRASFGDPWIFKRITEFVRTGHHLEPPSAVERAEMALYHVRRMVEIKGESVGIREMRKQLTWYLHGTPGSSAYRNRCYALNTLEDAENLINEWLDHARNEDLSWI
ncbi:MAG: tRNA dihydrouridine synthase DusB [Sulfobacillus thermosulfidooxidans]|uniref:tRNA-dihydrouridine synthase n=1 Tax=Sulfobacillus thermosulfidooxidans TaxID=28034 RepID=A0A2T2X0P5_SULTH|nr:MAG: tRNA dihydrouridine synthase DusB [Sulfobacillus thermosulfidooxidans]